MFVIEVVEGELLEEIEAAAKGAGITDAAIVSLIGAVDDFTISSMPLNDAARDQPHQPAGQKRGRARRSMLSVSA